VGWNVVEPWNALEPPEQSGGGRSEAEVGWNVVEPWNTVEPWNVVEPPERSSGGRNKVAGAGAKLKWAKVMLIPAGFTQETASLCSLWDGDGVLIPHVIPFANLSYPFPGSIINPDGMRTPNHKWMPGNKTTMDDTIRRMTLSNRQGWDALAAVHARTYDIDRLLAGRPLLNEVIQREVGDVCDKSLIHLLCHIGTDTLSWALLGARVTGVDISPKSLEVARGLAWELRVDADFIESNILDLTQKVQNKFDIVFSSTGVLCWLPDINAYARSVRRLLKNGGFFYLFDGHPFRNLLLDENGEVHPEHIVGDYFRKRVWEYEGMGDYTDPDFLTPTPSYEWDWTLGEVVTALCDAGLRIEFLHEFPQYYYSGYTPYDIEDNKVEPYPCTFSLKASAPRKG